MTTIELLQKAGFKSTKTFDDETNEAEEKLGIKLAQDYKEYLINFAQLSIKGHELTGVVVKNYLNVVTATCDARQYLLPRYHDMYVIESLGIDGIIIWQKPNGEVYQTVPDGIPDKIQSSFYDYLEKEILI